jgi:hypothetical protein
MIYLGIPINFLFPFSAPLSLRVKNSSYANLNSDFKAEAQGRGEKKGLIGNAQKIKEKRMRLPWFFSAPCGK